MEIATILKKKGTILDVRSYEEFIGGHVAGSFNIPLQEIQHRMQEILNSKHLLYCVAPQEQKRTSKVFLTANGIECYNGGLLVECNLQAQAEL
jgi:rhodanese-related sulfurtransferase